MFNRRKEGEQYVIKMAVDTSFQCRSHILVLKDGLNLHLTMPAMWTNLDEPSSLVRIQGLIIIHILLTASMTDD